jgi:hypothetical protein
MTIKQFQELYFIAQSDALEIDKSILMVSALTGKLPDEVDKMPMRKFNRICAKISKKFEELNSTLHNGKPRNFTIVNGRVYRINYDIDKVNAGAYVEAITFGSDVVTNLHKIMASICTPVTWWGRERKHKKVAESMEQMDFKAAYHAAVFFYLHFQISIKVIRPYLVKELIKKGVPMEEAEVVLSTSSEILDGFTMPKWSQSLKLYLLNRFGV